MRTKNWTNYTKQKLEKTPYFTKEDYHYSEEQIDFLNAYLNDKLESQSSYGEGIINDYAEEAQRVLLNVKTKYLLVNEDGDVLPDFVMASDYDEARELVKGTGIAFHDVVEESLHLSNEISYIKQEQHVNIIRALGVYPVKVKPHIRQRNLTLPMMKLIDTLNEQKEMMDEEDFTFFLEESVKMANSLLGKKLSREA